MLENCHSKRIEALRSDMQSKNINACIILSSDPHLSEYLPEHWQSRVWFSGFTGSMGTLIVTQNFAGLWADSRYWEQAAKELKGSGIELVKVLGSASIEFIDYLADTLPKGSTVAVDGDCLGISLYRALSSAFTPKGIQLKIDSDPIAKAWPDRPALPKKPVYEHLAPAACVSRHDKLTQVRELMAKQGAKWHLISTVDDIAWLFNLRGQDVDCNPVFLAHALIGHDQAILFVSAGQITPEVELILGKDNIALRPYEDTKSCLHQLVKPQDRILIDPARVTSGFRNGLADGVEVIEHINPSTLLKSRKTADEVQNIRQAMEKDGAALAEFFAWFETNVNQTEMTELTIDEMITAARARQEGFVCTSFDTIAGFNANGALPHYRATAEDHASISGNGFLLIDSGAQYLNGTTDITRVVAVGTPSAEQKRDFTLVLKGVIALSRAHFPKDTLGPMLDALARAPMWQAGIDFGHGTGHGVGYFLNVHEGPQSISRAMTNPNHAMKVGMVTSIEPGIYRPSQWGVRIENLVLNVDAEKTAFGEFLKFETLTLCPIDTRCMDKTMLSPGEIRWINDYHKEVWVRLSPRVTGDALAWLEQFTQTI